MPTSNEPTEAPTPSQYDKAQDKLRKARNAYAKEAREWDKKRCILAGKMLFRLLKDGHIKERFYKNAVEHYYKDNESAKKWLELRKTERPKSDKTGKSDR